MGIKKAVTSFLLVSFFTLFASPICAEVPQKKDQNLYEFLKNTEEVSAEYSYPSMKIASAEAGQVKLPAHTPIVIRCDETITTSNIVSGGTVKFSVVGDVRSNDGKVLTSSGTPVSATISFASQKGMIGKSGTVTINDFHTNTVDGSYVPLSSSVSANPDDKMTLSIVLSVLVCPLFLLMKGDDAQVPAGTTKTAYTVSDVYVKVNQF
jgi:hypothetical protein